MISLSHIRKSYGQTNVLQSIDMELEEGTVTALLGANGAGKTTLMKCMLGLVYPDRGEISFDQRPAVNHHEEIRHEIGYMPQNARFPENMRVSEIIDLITRIRGDKRGIDMTLFHAFKMKAEKEKQFKHLSGGNRQKVNAALAFMFNPRYLFLDEPSNGLDPLSNQALKKQIARHADQGSTVLITSHLLNEMQEVADRIIYLKGGEIWIDSSVSDLLVKTSASTLEQAIAGKLEQESYSEVV